MKKSQLRQLIREEIKKSYSVNEGKNSWFDEFLSNNNAFWNELSKTKKTKENILKLAKKYEVNPQDAIRFTKEMYNMGTKLDEDKSVNEGKSDPMSSILQSFEKAMTDKAAYAEIVAELEGAADHVKPKLMQMADEFIPEKREGVLELISDLENGDLDPEDIGAHETRDILIQQFKEFIKITDFAIATIKKYAQ